MEYRQINRLLLLLCAYCCFSTHLFAQDKSNPKETFSEAESYFLFEEYTEALPLYVKLKDKLPNNYNLDYKIGRCYLNIPYEKEKATGYLENAVKHISIVSKETSIKEANAPLDALFYLGDAYRVNNQLDKAIKTYQEFRDRTTDKIYDFTLVDDEIKSCQLALIMKKRPIDATSVNLGGIINTRFSETNPVVIPDETMIVYAAKLPFYQAMYYAKKENGKWSEPVNMIPNLGIDGDCLPTSISPDGSELYLYRSNQFLGDLYVTNFKNGKWTKIRKLNGNINTKYWESHACISSDGKTLYFTSNKPDGYGGLDIYKTTRMSTLTDDWGPAINLGPVINSNYNDDTPFITVDGKRLYFSSFGHETIGGYDIFYSDLKDDGTWGNPVNIGYPVNTTGDELFFNPVKDGSVAYMAKHDPKGFGRFDIFRYEIDLNKPVQTCTVTGNIKLPDNTDIVYVALYDKLKKDTVLHVSGPHGKFTFEALPGDYDLYLTCKGCQSQKVAITIPKGSKGINKDINVVMQSSVNAIFQVADTPINEVNSSKAKVSENAKVQGEGTAIPGGEIGNSKDTISEIKDTVKSEVASGVVSKEASEPANRAISGNQFWAKWPYLLSCVIIAIITIWIIIIIGRRGKKEKDS